MTGRSKGERRDSMEGVRIGDVIAAWPERDLPTVKEDETIDEVVEAMDRHRHSRLLYVVDDEGGLLGTVSLQDLVKYVFNVHHGSHVHSRHIIDMLTCECARDLMRKNPTCTRKEEDVGKVLKRMIGKGMEEIPVVDDKGKLVADLTMIDLLRAVTKE